MVIKHNSYITNHKAKLITKLLFLIILAFPVIYLAADKLEKNITNNSNQISNQNNSSKSREEQNFDLENSEHSYKNYIIIGIIKSCCKNYFEFKSYILQKKSYKGRKIYFLELEYDDSEFNLNKKIKKLDGIIITDGCYVDPEIYCEQSVYINKKNKCRDLLDFCLIEYARMAKIPVMGICRGFAVINIYFGGTLDDFKFYKRTQGIKYECLQYLLSGTIKYFDYIPKFNNEISIKRLGILLDVLGKCNNGFIQCIKVRDNSWFAIGINMNPVISKINQNVFDFYFEQMLEAVNWRKQTPLYKIINFQAK